MTYTHKFSSKRLLVLQAAYSFVGQLGIAVLFPYLKQHFSFAQISLQSALSYLAPIIILPLVRGFRVRLVIVIAIVIAALRTAYTSHVDSASELYLYGIVNGIPLIFFWIPYEILYFHEHDVKKHGQQSAWYFGVFVASSIVMPAVAGLVADHFGFQKLFYWGASLMVIPLLIALHLSGRKIPVNLKESLKHLRGVITLFIFDGLFLSLAPGLIALSLLNFTSTAVQFGVVNSIVAGGALLVSLLTAHISDRRGDRRAIIYPVSVISAGLLIYMGIQESLYSFALLFLIWASLRTVAQPIVNALPMDLRHDHTKLYMGRQFLISIGRVIGFGLTWAAVLAVGLFPMYLIYALSYLIYILIVRRALKTPVLTIEPLPFDG